jgi:hypothetical protein
MLPEKRYQPFFLKVLHDFIAHHNLSQDLEKPQGNMKIHKALSCVLDIMSHSMGEEKRDNLLKELDQYIQGLPEQDR